MRSPKRWGLVVLVGVLAVAVAATLAVLATRPGGQGPVTGGAPPTVTAPPGESGQPAPSAPATPSASPLTDHRAAGEAFLADYVDPDGRVVRRDQGDDTVSEGQAYALLIAVAVEDRDAFDRVWGWTRQNLLRPDGLLSWRWADGAVADAESASDADLDAARALVLAADRFGDEEYRAAGIALGRAVLDHETVVTARGRILTAGTWAMQQPYAYNPSYASPAATRVLAAADPDPRWAALDEGSAAVTAAVLDTTDLPPDWAQVHADGRVDPMPGAAGRGNDGVRYGYDATRMPIRFAESCAAADVGLAARLTTALDRFDGVPAARDLGGQPLTGDASPVAAAGQAAAHAAAGDDETATAELDEMARVAQASPTYYGSAWNALGRIMLTTDLLGGCPPLAD